MSEEVMLCSNPECECHTKELPQSLQDYIELEDGYPQATCKSCGRRTVLSNKGTCLWCGESVDGPAELEPRIRKMSIEEQVFRTLFDGDGGGLYNVIDTDGLRKPAITTKIADVRIEDGGFNEEIWNVKINWRLLSRWFGGRNDI